jgi:hypothetical protein
MAQGQQETWLNKKESAYLCDLSPQQFDKSIRLLIPPEAIRKTEHAFEFDAKALGAALVKYRTPEAQAVGDDPLLSGSDSPNLERYRRIKGDLAELELEERRRTHVDVGLLEAALVRFGMLLRRAGEILQRRFGVEAAEIFNNAIEEALRLVRAEFDSSNRPGPGSRSDNGNGKASPDHAAVRGTGNHPPKRPLPG